MFGMNNAVTDEDAGDQQKLTFSLSGTDSTKLTSDWWLVLQVSGLLSTDTGTHSDWQRKRKAEKNKEKRRPNDRHHDNKKEHTTTSPSKCVRSGCGGAKKSRRRSGSRRHEDYYCLVQIAAK